jgi:nicotinamidase-related amidase
MLPINATLIVIDVQQGFLEPSWGPRNNLDAEANIANIIDAWRRTGRPVRHVHHSSRSKSGSFYRESVGYETKPEAAPLAGEPIHIKDVNSAFIGTSLEADLRAAEVDTLIMVGLTTNHCVSTSARMASNLGFVTFVVEDATATFDRAALDGSMRSAADVHSAALSDLSDEFATIVSTQFLLRELRVAAR